MNDEQREQTVAPLLLVKRCLAEGKEKGLWHDGFDVEMDRCRCGSRCTASFSAHRW